MPSRMGGMPTARAMMIPIRVPRSREFQPEALEEEEEAEPEPVPLLEEEEGEEASPPPLPLVAVDDVDAGDAPVATGPTSMVVVELGCPGVSWLQLSIIAAISPVSRP
jgi:hypothetical protein